MLNYIWGFMILVGIVIGALMGNMAEITAAVLDSAKEAINLCIIMFGVVGLWTGIMKIAECSGLVAQLTRKMAPIIHLLFPNIPKGHKANEYIASNMVANMLGLGWAATPAGIMAMKELDKLNKKHGVASHDMCMFLIVNVSSLQLVPVTMIAYRSQYGSINPSEIIVPALAATVISTIVGIGYGKFKYRKE